MNLLYMKKLFIIFITALLLLINGEIKTYSASMDESEDSYSITLPAGSMLKIMLQQRISSEINNVGDIIEFIIQNDYNFQGVNFIPKNTKIIGKIIKLERAKSGQNGLFEILLYKMTEPNYNEEYSILGHIWTKSQDGIIGGEVTQRAGFKKTPHYVKGIGGIVQLIPDGPRLMGKEKELLPGVEVITVLDRSLKIVVPKD